MNEQAIRNVANWLASCQTRFKNMYDADLDKEGWPRLKQAMDNYDTRGFFTVGEMQYLFNRSHPRGALPKYNHHRGYHKIYGEITDCPLRDLVDSNIVNWRTGGNGVIQPQFATAIKAETRWEFRNGNLRPQPNTAYDDLFGT